MYTRKDEQGPQEAPTLEELMMLAKQEREALAKRGGKGSARRKLEPHRAAIGQMLIDELPVAVICDLLAKVGVEVNLKSLFKFLREEMQTEYASYLKITGRGKKENRAETESTPKVAAPAQAVGQGKPEDEIPAPAAIGHRISRDSIKNIETRDQLLKRMEEARRQVDEENS